MTNKSSRISSLLYNILGMEIVRRLRGRNNMYGNRLIWFEHAEDPDSPPPPFQNLKFLIYIIKLLKICPRPQWQTQITEITIGPLLNFFFGPAHAIAQPILIFHNLCTYITLKCVVIYIIVFHFLMISNRWT